MLFPVGPLTSLSPTRDNHFSDTFFQHSLACSRKLNYMLLGKALSLGLFLMSILLHVSVVMFFLNSGFLNMVVSTQSPEFAHKVSAR